MHFHHRNGPTHNGAPQAVAAAFVFVFVMMMLLPFAQVSFAGSSHSRPLLFLFRSDVGMNVFALLLILVPIAGVVAEMTMRRAWDVVAAIVAAIGFVLVCLTYLTLKIELGSSLSGITGVAPGGGAYVFGITLLIVAIVTSIVAFRARKD